MTFFPLFSLNVPLSCKCKYLVQMSVSLSQYWTDIYLSWNPDNYPGVQNLRFPSDQIWTPDILLYNRSELTTSLKTLKLQKSRKSFKNSHFLALQIMKTDNVKEPIWPLSVLTIWPKVSLVAKTWLQMMQLLLHNHRMLKYTTA